MVDVKSKCNGQMVTKRHTTPNGCKKELSEDHRMKLQTGNACKNYYHFSKNYGNEKTISNKTRYCGK